MRTKKSAVNSPSRQMTAFGASTRNCTVPSSRPSRMKRKAVGLTPLKSGICATRNSGEPGVSPGPAGAAAAAAGGFAAPGAAGTPGDFGAAGTPGGDGAAPGGFGAAPGGAGGAAGDPGGRGAPGGAGGDGGF